MPSVCTVVLTGAPLTRRAPDITSTLLDAGWAVQLVATPAASGWVDAAALTELGGHAPRTQFRTPVEPKSPGRPDVVVVVPATFNTINKLAAGLADTYAHSLLCEALGSGIPVLAVPMVNDRLWGHPAWVENLHRLRAAGVGFVDLRTGSTEPAAVPSGTGDAAVAAFDPRWLLDRMDAVAQQRR